MRRGRGSSSTHGGSTHIDHPPFAPVSRLNPSSHLHTPTTTIIRISAVPRQARQGRARHHPRGGGPGPLREARYRAAEARQGQARPQGRQEEGAFGCVWLTLDPLQGRSGGGLGEDRTGQGRRAPPRVIAPPLPPPPPPNPPPHLRWRCAALALPLRCRCLRLALSCRRNKVETIGA